MAKKKRTQKTRKARGGTNRRRTSKATSSPPRPLSSSPSAGVRLLRERIEASGASRQVRRGLSQALARLEAEYELLLNKTGSRISLREPGRSSRSAKHSRQSLKKNLLRAATADTGSAREEVSFVPTPPELVAAMLNIAKITPQDIVYDLGCGDGRIVIAAAGQYRARGVGIDKDPQRIAEARQRAIAEGVANRVSFVQADLFAADIHEATVVTLYLLPSLNLELRPRLLDQLAPGTRVVSHEFGMGEWLPAQTLSVDDRQIYLWIVPDRPAELSDTA